MAPSVLARHSWVGGDTHIMAYFWAKTGLRKRAK
jgi:hypothetical protein